MHNIALKNNCIFFYGNPVGYLEKGEAVVDDDFKKEELQAWLGRGGYRTSWRQGVYERLIEKNANAQAEEGAPIQNMRIYQLSPSISVEMRHLTLERMRGLGLEPEPGMYEVVYDGVASFQDKEEIFEQFRYASPGNPPGYKGIAMGKSDVLELYGEDGSQFFYNDQHDFLPIEFQNAQDQAVSMGMSM